MANIYTVHGAELVPDSIDPSQDDNIACPVEVLAANGYRWIGGSCDFKTGDLQSCAIALFRHDKHGFFIDIEDMHGERIIAFKASDPPHLLAVLDKAAPLLRLLALDQRYAIYCASSTISMAADCRAIDELTNKQAGMLLDFAELSRNFEDAASRLEDVATRLENAGLIVAEVTGND